MMCRFGFHHIHGEYMRNELDRKFVSTNSFQKTRFAPVTNTCLPF